ADYGYELIYPDVVVHFPFLDGASLTVFRKDVERTATSIARVSKRDAETFKRLVAARERVAAMPPAEAAKTREGVFAQRLGVLSGYDAARQVWESPHIRAANLYGGRF